MARIVVLSDTHLSPTTPQRGHLKLRQVSGPQRNLR
jgi:hypothetical protein